MTVVPTNLELMEMHVDALFTRDLHGDLAFVNEPGGVIASRFFIGQTKDGSVIGFRGDVTEAQRAALTAAALLEELGDTPLSPEPYREILASSAPVTHTESGPAFCFPRDLTGDETVLITDDNAHLLTPLLSTWAGDVHTCHPLMGVVVDGRAVSVCGTVRVTPLACEAGVDTAPVARGSGYAARVVSAWARAIRASGKTPLYSTSWRNEASRSVARKLGLLQFGSDLHIT
jgi:hypothetical protein